MQPLFFVAPLPLKEFQHSATALATLTCGYDVTELALFLLCNLLFNVWLLLISVYFDLQLFNRLEQVWLSWSHSWNHWKKARHIFKRGNLSIYRVIIMQVSWYASFKKIDYNASFIISLLLLFFHRKRLLEIFLALRSELSSKWPFNEISYREFKV